MSKVERNKRENFKCVHRHNGMPDGHPNCYDQAHGIREKIGYFDIESSNLSATFGIILSYCILSEEGETLYKRIITPEELKSGDFDKNLCIQFCQDVRNFDRIVGWYSSRFDIPFVRTRCKFHNIESFPVYKEIKQTDAWKLARNCYKFHSNRLEAVADFFGIPSKGHKLNPEIWIKCLSGNTEALDFVLTHNIEDVYTTRAVFRKISDCMALQNVSI